MLPLKRTYFLFGVFSRLRNASKAAACTGRPVSSDGQDQVKDHPFVRMNNPYKEPHKGCVLCDVTVDFKNIQHACPPLSPWKCKRRGVCVQLLSQFISPHTGRIYGRHITGLCGRKQKEISKAIKKAHSMGFMSVTHKHPELMRDPNICSFKHAD
ncbi:28S ribosomal protein S18c, mitochondrial isoform X1 [Syngnathus typhle]|uniref:28S ribosomal protein S18c, mitochondrial isoform X1 n=1 Tax=Syngnathus typhle TaxID=161592 RepID=UPI002A6A28DD|nr:28S ribosomal protein S18c, mitochondrial isoform X1 [Syngnathus typhle]